VRPPGWSKTECWLSLRTPDHTVAKPRYAEALSRFTKDCERLSSDAPPVDLTYKQTVALSGVLYKTWLEGLSDNPGDPSLWQHVLEANEAAKDGNHGLSAFLLAGTDERRLASLSARFGAITDALLVNEGLRLSVRSRAAVIEQVARAMTEAAERLHANASGDYSPDPNAARFPQWEKSPSPEQPCEPLKGASNPQSYSTMPVVLTWEALISSWALEASPTAKTLSGRRGIIARLQKAIPSATHPDALTPIEAIAFKNALLSAGISPRTIQDHYLSGLKALFVHGITNRLVESNPFEGVKLSGAAAKKARRSNVRKEGITDDEALVILKAALKDDRPAYHWLPWLAAFTGARITELCQLRVEDVRVTDRIACLMIRPEAGSIKTDAGERLVPLHDQLIDMGFMAFVKTVERSQGPTAPLFYDPSREKLEDRSKATTSPAKKLGERLAAWVRSLSSECGSLSDRRLQPNHGWRHRFVGLRRRYGLDHELAEYLIGHALPGMGDVYGGQHVEGLKREIDKLPRYDL